MKLFDEILCAIGAHDIHTRINGGAREKVCVRRGCSYRVILQERRDSPGIKIEQAKKSPRMRRIEK